MITIIISAVSLIVLRFFMAASIYLGLPKKKRKLYLSSYSLINRWFFLSTAAFILAQGKKQNRKGNLDIAKVRFYRFLNICEHLLLCIAIIGFLLCRLGIFPHEIENIWGTLYSLNVLICFIIFAIDELFSNLDYHRSRYQ